MNPGSYYGYTRGNVPTTAPAFTTHPPASMFVFGPPPPQRGIPVYLAHQQQMGSTYYNYAQQQPVQAHTNYSTDLQPGVAHYPGSAHYTTPPMHHGGSHPQPVGIQTDYTQPPPQQHHQPVAQQQHNSGQPAAQPPSFSHSQPYHQFIPPRLQALAKHYQVQASSYPDSGFSTSPVQGSYPTHTVTSTSSSSSSPLSGSAPSFTPRSAPTAKSTPSFIPSSSTTLKSSPSLIPSSNSGPLSTPNSISSSVTTTTTVASSFGSFESFLSSKIPGGSVNRQDLVNFYVQKHAKETVTVDKLDKNANCVVENWDHEIPKSEVNNNKTAAATDQVNGKRSNDGRNLDDATHEVVSLLEDGRKVENATTEVVNLWEEPLPSQNKGNETMENSESESASPIVVRYDNDRYYDEVHEIENEVDNETSGVENGISEESFIEEHEFMCSDNKSHGTQMRTSVVCTVNETTDDADHVGNESELESLIPAVVVEKSEDQSCCGKDLSDKVFDDNKPIVVTNGGDTVNVDIVEDIANDKNDKNQGPDRMESKDIIKSEEDFLNIASIIVKQAIAKGICKFYESMGITDSVPEIKETLETEHRDSTSSDRLDSVSSIYSWKKDEVCHIDGNDDDDKDPAADVKSDDEEIDNDDEKDQEDEGLTRYKEMTNDFEKFFFKHNASKHGISITSPGKTSAHTKVKRVKSPTFKTSATKSSGTSTLSSPRARTRRMSQPLYSAREIAMAARSFSGGSARSSREGSLSDAVDAFKMKAMMRGIHIEAGDSRSITDSDSEVDNFTRKDRGHRGSRGSVDSGRQRFLSTPDMGNVCASFNSPNVSPEKRKRHLSGGTLRANALEFNPDSNNVSSINASLDSTEYLTADEADPKHHSSLQSPYSKERRPSQRERHPSGSLRAEAPEFNPDSISSSLNASLDITDTDSNPAATKFKPVLTNTGHNFLTNDATMYELKRAGSIQNDATTEHKKMKLTPRTVDVTTITDAVPNLSVGVQAVSERCLVDAATETDSMTNTATEMEELQKSFSTKCTMIQPETTTKQTQSMMTKTRTKSMMTEAPIRRSVETQSMSMEVQSKSTMTDVLMSDLEAEWKDHEFIVRELQIELMGYKELEFEEMLNRMRSSMTTINDKSRVNSVLKLLEDAEMKVKLVVNTTVSAIQSGSYRTELPDLLLLLPDATDLLDAKLPSNSVTDKEINKHSENTKKVSKSMLDVEDSSDDDVENDTAEPRKHIEHESEPSQNIQGDINHEKISVPKSDQNASELDFDSISDISALATAYHIKQMITEEIGRIDETVHVTKEINEGLSTDLSKKVNSQIATSKTDFEHVVDSNEKTNDLGKNIENKATVLLGAGDGLNVENVKKDIHSSGDRVCDLMTTERSENHHIKDSTRWSGGDGQWMRNQDVVKVDDRTLVAERDKEMDVGNMNNNAGSLDKYADFGSRTTRRSSKRIVAPLEEDVELAGGDGIDMIEKFPDKKIDKHDANTHEISEAKSEGIPEAQSDFKLEAQSAPKLDTQSAEKLDAQSSFSTDDQYSILPGTQPNITPGAQPAPDVVPFSGLADPGMGGMSTMPLIMNNINPVLYQAVLAQLIQAYPEMACNQEMLTQTAIQQTCLLQMYMGNQAGDGNAMTNMNAIGTGGAVGGTPNMAGQCSLLPAQTGGVTPAMMGASADNSDLLNQFSQPSNQPAICSNGAIPLSSILSTQSQMPDQMLNSNQNETADMNKHTANPMGNPGNSDISSANAQPISQPASKLPSFNPQHKLNGQAPEKALSGAKNVKSCSEDVSKKERAKSGSDGHVPVTKATKHEENSTDANLKSNAEQKGYDMTGVKHMIQAKTKAASKTGVKYVDFSPPSKPNSVSNDKNVPETTRDLPPMRLPNNLQDLEKELSGKRKFRDLTPLRGGRASNCTSSVTYLDAINLHDDIGTNRKTENKSQSSQISSSTKDQSSDKFSDSTPTHQVLMPSVSTERVDVRSKRPNFGNRPATSSSTSAASSSFGGRNGGSKDSNSKNTSNTKPEPYRPPRFRKKSSPDATANVGTKWKPPLLGEKPKTNFGGQSKPPGFGAQPKTVGFGAQPKTVGFGPKPLLPNLRTESSTESWDNEVDDYAPTFTLQGSPQEVFMRPENCKKKKSPKKAVPSLLEMDLGVPKKSPSSVAALDTISITAPGKSVTDEVGSEASGEWCEVPTRRRRHSSQSRESKTAATPLTSKPPARTRHSSQSRESMKGATQYTSKAPARTRHSSLSRDSKKTMPPYSSKAPAQTKALVKESPAKTQKTSNFERLVARIQDTYPHADRDAVINAINQVREARGSLSGLSMEVIIEKCKLYIPKPDTPSPSSISTSSNRVPGLNYETKRRTLNLPTYVPSDLTMTSSIDEEICVICFDQLASEPVKELDCRHQFHTSCITQWVQQERTCPTCRTHALFPEDFPRLGK